jgi:hypothetical protein
MNTRRRSITRAAWGILLVDGVALLLGDLVRHAALQLLIYCALVPLSLFLAVAWLVWVYRSQFARLRGWLAVVLLFVAISLLQTFQQAAPSLSLLLPVLLLTAMWLVLLASTVFLSKHDAGLSIIAWTSLLGIWFLYLLWRSQGNLIMHLLAFMEPTNRPLAIQFLEPLFFLSACLLPLGFFSFLGHTLRLLIKEMGEGIL